MAGQPHRGKSIVLHFAGVDLSVGEVSIDSLEVCVEVVGYVTQRG